MSTLDPQGPTRTTNTAMNEGPDVTNVTEGENRSLLADLAPEGPSTCKPTLSSEIARFFEGETFLSVTC